MAKEVCWDLSGKREFKGNEKWYDHIPESLLGNEDSSKPLWDLSVRTDHGNKERRLYLVNIERKREAVKVQLLQFRKMEE